MILKPAERTPVGIMILLELIEDLLPAGVLIVVNGFCLEAGKPLASNPRVRKGNTLKYAFGGTDGVSV